MAQTKPATAYGALAKQRWPATSLVCACFAFFTFLLPGTWLVGLVEGWERVAHNWWMLLLLPPPIMSVRFRQGVDFFRWGHLFLSGFWALAAPFQLSPSLRKRYPVVHRTMGYVMLASALNISATVVYWGWIGKLNDHGIHAWTFYRPTWIVFTSTAALSLAAARRRQYQTHAELIIVHMASGMPLAWGRAFAWLFALVYMKTGLFNMHDPKEGVVGFWTMVYICTVFSYAIAAYSIFVARAAAARATAPKKVA